MSQAGQPRLHEIAAGLLRATLPLPIGPRHVQVYFVPSDSGWLAVDAGLGLPDAADCWRALLAELDAPLSGLIVTHFHPDHVGAAADVASVSGAPVYQGELDYEDSKRVWGSEEWPERLAAWFRRHGTPPDVADDVLEQGRLARPLIRYARSPRTVREGDVVGGWTVIEVPGHSDGHIALVRDGVLVSGDHLLADVSPNVGRYPEGRPDPLGAYLDSLERTTGLGCGLALPGHGEPIADPGGRARQLIEHHRERLAATAETLRGSEPQSAYDVSLPLFPGDLPPSERRFAVAETLAHLERLAAAGRAREVASASAVVRWARDD